MLGKFYQWLYYNVLESLHEIFDQEYEVDLDSLQTVCKKAGVNLKNEEISRIFAKYSKHMYLDYDAIADIYDEKKRDRKFQAKYYPTQHVTKNDIFTALKNRLKIRSCSLRELFGLVTMTGNDEISLYDATRILVTELNTPGYDFTEAVHKYVINHMVAGSKTQVSFKSLQDEFEKTFNIDHNQSEIAYRENCIKKMLDKIALKLVQKEIDLKTLDRDEFDYKDMTDFLKVDLNIFNQEPLKKIEKLDLSKHPLLAQLSNKEAVEEMIKKQESKDRPPEEDQVKAHEITEKEHQIFKDTMDYIMDQKEIITVEEFIELMQEYLGKQKHCMEVLYRLKQYIKRRH